MLLLALAYLARMWLTYNKVTRFMPVTQWMTKCHMLPLDSYCSLGVSNWNWRSPYPSKTSFMSHNPLIIVFWFHKTAESSDFQPQQASLAMWACYISINVKFKHTRATNQLLLSSFFQLLLRQYRIWKHWWFGDKTFHITQNQYSSEIQNKTLLLLFSFFSDLWQKSRF